MQTLKSKALVDNRFEIIELLGSGGMGMVYKAKQLDLDRLVALKFLLPHLYEHEDSLARFKIEAEAMSTLNHRHINLFYAYGIWHGRAPYIAMEYLDAPTLSQVLIANDGKLTWRRTLQLVLQICTAIAHAHAHGIIHRDLKPGNIFVFQEANGDDHVKVSDFGLAKLVDTTTAQKLTATGLTVGSPHYMSPEQAQAQHITAATDIYALGCIMYECLFGRPPFDADTAAGIIYQQVSRSDRLLDQKHEKGLPEGVVATLETAMAKDPAARFPSMEDMAAAINSILAKTAKQPDGRAAFTGSVRSSPQSPSNKSTFAGTIKAIAIALSVLLVGAACLNFQAATIALMQLWLQKAPNTYDRTKIELEQVELFKKWQRPDLEQAALNDLSSDLASAIKSREFQSEPLNTQRQYFRAAGKALMSWHPRQVTDVERLKGVQHLVRKVDGEDSVLFSTLWYALTKQYDLPIDRRRLDGMALALPILEGGPDGLYRSETMTLLANGLGLQTSMTDQMMDSQVSTVQQLCSQHRLAQAIDLAVSIYMSYCTGDQSPLARSALIRTADALQRIADEEKSESARPVVSFCHRALATYYSNVGDDQAINFLRQQIDNEVHQKFKEPFVLAKAEMLLGDALRQRGQLPQALEAYSKGVAHDKDHKEGKISTIGACCEISQADILCTDKMWQKAYDKYRFVGVRSDDDVSNHKYVALMNQVIPGAKLGIKQLFSLNAAGRTREQLFSRHIDIAEAYATNNDFERALIEYQSARQYADTIPQQAGPVLRSARVYSKQNNPAKAIATWEAGLQMVEGVHLTGPDENNQVLAWKIEYAETLYNAGRVDQAKGVLEGILANGVIEKDDKNCAILRAAACDLASIYEVGGNRASAAKYARKMLELDQKFHHSSSRGFPDEHIDLALIAALENRNEKADTEFRLALSRMTDSHEHDYPIAMAGLAKLRLQAGNQAEAKRLLQESITRWDQIMYRWLHDQHCLHYFEAAKLLKGLPTTSTKSNPSQT